MYFITNQEDYIIVASKNFLDKIGYRDICSISLAIKNKQIATLNENELKVSTFDKPFKYESSELHSVFGELKLYKLVEKRDTTQELEDENIAYLRKIKSGLIETQDNEFNIPEIKKETLTKESKEPSKDVSTLLDKKEPKESIQAEELIEDKEIKTDSQSSFESKTEETLEVIKIFGNKDKDDTKSKIEIKEYTSTKIDNKDYNTITKTTIKEEDTTNETLLKIVDKQPLEHKEVSQTIHNKIEKEEDRTVEALGKLIDKQPLEQKEKDTANETLLKIVDNQPTEYIDNKVEKEEDKTAEALEKLIELDANIEEVKKEHKSEDTTSKILLKTVDKQLLEQKEKDIASETLLKIVDRQPEEYKEVSQTVETKLEKEEYKTIEASEESVKPDTNIEEVKKEHKAEDTASEALLKTVDKQPQEHKEVSQTIESKLEKEEDRSVEVSEKIIELDTNTEEVKKEDKKSGLSGFKSKLFPWGKSDYEIEIEEETSAIKTANELKSAIEKSYNKVEIDTNKDVTVEEIEKTKDEHKSDNVISKLSLEEEELAILKEAKDAKKDLKKESRLKTETIYNTPNNTLYKLIGLQINNIDIDENAKKLSIDKDNYKLLLENYLDELDNYKDDLANGNRLTIDMLTDASNLLSLDLITNKLELLLSNKRRGYTVKEISLITTLIRERLDKNSTYEQKKETQIVDKDTLSQVPQDIIEISNSKELLKLVNTEKVDFNPKRAADDLNLPEGLIVEFVNDFVKQSKEHLGQLVNAYKNDDIKTLQTTAHMLKGAASNLRLDSIAEILFKIQKEKSVDRSGKLIKKFIAKLKGLEQEVEKLEG